MAIIKTKHGHYAFRVYVTDNLGNRKQFYRSSPTWTRKGHAEIAQSDFLKSIHQPKSMTFGEVYLLYIENKRMTVKKNTLYNLEISSKGHILPEFEKMRIDRITYQNILSWQRKLITKSFSNEHLIKIQKNFKSILHWSYLHDYIDKDPCRTMKYVKHDEIPKKKTILTPSEFTQFIQVVDDPIFKTMYMILYWCGLRIGEVVALTYDDINLAKGTLTVNKTYNFQYHEIHTPKTKNSYRVVEMPLAVCNEVNQLMKYYSDKYHHDQDSRLFPVGSYPKISSRLKEWIALSKTKPFTHHDLRHSCVSLLANAGFNDFQAAKRMGHDVKMFNETYGHLFESKQKEMTKAMNKMQKN